MRRVETARSHLILFAIFLIPVVWAALLTAPSLSSGLPAMVEHLSVAIHRPFDIRWVDDTPRCLLFFTLAYGLGVGVYLAPRETIDDGRSMAAPVGAGRKPYAPNIAVKCRNKTKF